MLQAEHQAAWITQCNTVSGGTTAGFTPQIVVKQVLGRDSSFISLGGTGYIWQTWVVLYSNLGVSTVSACLSTYLSTLSTYIPAYLFVDLAISLSVCLVVRQNGAFVAFFIFIPKSPFSSVFVLISFLSLRFFFPSSLPSHFSLPTYPPTHH